MTNNLFHKFNAENLCVIPLKGGVPQVEWSQYFYALPAPDDAAAWKSKEYALVCGAVSGVIAIDIDVDEDADKIYALSGTTPVRKRGSKGFTAFYKYNGELSRNWKTPQGEVICELLSDKRLTTIPPSPHRKTGKPYIWMDLHGLGDIDLPTLSDDFILFMDAKYPAPAKRIMPPVQYYKDDNIALSDVGDMLDYISSDCSRDQWINIGMALRDEFGDAACGLWHDWSGKASGRYNHNDAQSAWRSFNAGGVTIGTIVYHAKQGGWLPRVETKHEFSVDLSYLRPSEETKIIKLAPPPPVEIKITGLVGEIANWITDTAISPQPVLSLSAAIAFMGMVKGRRIKHKVQSARTNMFTLALAPTGAGKDYPQKAIDRLAVACGLDDSLMGRPTSGTALLTGIDKAKGVSLLIVDEMGRYMGNSMAKDAQSFQREIADYMIELFSSANKTFRGRQYADDNKNPQVIIKDPHFCCFGSTVPQKLQAACKGTDVVDGFLNRWLVFASNERPEKRFDIKTTVPPQELVDKICQWIGDNPIVTDNYGNHEIKEAAYTQEAWDMFLAFEKRMLKKIETEAFPMNELYVRSAEHVIKLSMVICDSPIIGVPEIETAISIVEQSNDNIYSFASNITDTQHEADLVFVLDMIKKNPDITRNQLTQKTRKLTQRLRVDILNQLCEAGNVELVKDGKRESFRVL